MLIDLLSNTGYIIVNKEIIKKIGLHEAILLGELCSEYIYWKKKYETVNEFFYSTRENIEENTGLSAYQQRTAISNLVKKDIIVMKSEGMPLKTWYFINENKLQELLFDNIEEDTENEVEKPSSENVIQQDVKKIDNKELNNFRTSYEEILQHDVKEVNINNNKNNNKENKIDGLFNFIINNKKEIPEEFKNVDYEKLYQTLERYEMLYSCDILEQISSENKEKIKVITYVIALMVRDNIPSNTITRTKLIDIYKLCKNKQIEYENTNKEISDFISYYYKSVINSGKKNEI